MTSTESRRKRQDYPTPAQHRTGAKVSWNYYATEAEARTCADAAKHNADIALSEGYDFGFCAPGSIARPGRQNWHPDLWEVCLP